MALAILSSLGVWFAFLPRGARIFLSVPGYQSHCSPNCTFLGTMMPTCWFLCLILISFFVKRATVKSHTLSVLSSSCAQRRWRTIPFFPSCLLPFGFQDIQAPWQKVPWAKLGLQNAQTQFRPAHLRAPSLLKHLFTQHLLLSNNFKRKTTQQNT